MVRERRPQVVDPYDPDRTVPGSWDAASSLTIERAWIAQSSSISLTTATRVQTLTAKSLFSTNPFADVKPGDRVRDPDNPGEYLYVTAEGHSDTNPFTGWRPYIELPLEKVEG